MDLYHDLTQLLVKADKHAAMDMLTASELAKIDALDFIGLSDEDVEEERKE